MFCVRHALRQTANKIENNNKNPNNISVMSRRNSKMIAKFSFTAFLHRTGNARFATGHIVDEAEIVVANLWRATVELETNIQS